MGLCWFSLANILFICEALEVGGGARHTCFYYYFASRLNYHELTRDERLWLSEVAAGVRDAGGDNPWGSGTWQWARGGPLRSSSEVGPGELLAGEGLGNRKLGGALRGMINIRAPTYLMPASLPLFSIYHL